MNVPLLNSDVINSYRSHSPSKAKQIIYEKSPTQMMNTMSKEMEFPKPMIGIGNETRKINPSDSETFKVFVRARPLDGKESKGLNPKKRTMITKKEDNMVPKMKTKLTL
jgi:hypothetical protein